MILAGDSDTTATLTNWYWWALVPVLATALTSITIAVTVSRANRDREAREAHRTVTTGPGGTARGMISYAEYRWWNDGELLASQEEASKNADGPSLNQQFYVIDASLGQLAIALRRYRKAWWFGWGTNFKHRRLLAWHAAIHIAWMIWYIGATRAESSTGERLSGAESRVADALDLVGKHKIEHRKHPTATVKDMVGDELAQWLGAIIRKGPVEVEG